MSDAVPCSPKKGETPSLGVPFSRSGACGVRPIQRGDL